MPNAPLSDELNDIRARSVHYEGTLDSTRRKTLGQFFSGLPLGRLLGAISLSPAASSVIDPMAGHGDLLDAVAERAARNGQQLAHIHGVEIDPPTAVLCRERMEGWRHRFGNLAIRAGDAFDPRLAQTYLAEGYDLVIANPPYVRYQTLAAQNGNIPQLSPDEIRRHLGEIVGARVGQEEWRIWQTIIEKYSGLADLSVPSWILCASLVSENGTLALVAPATWRSRNYGAVIEYLLATFFELQYLVEDTQPGWFSDALVRTQLVVARRIKFSQSSTSIPSLSEGSKPRVGGVTVKVSPSASSDGSLIGASFSGDDPEKSFAEWLHLRASGDAKDILGLTAQQSTDLLKTTLASGGRRGRLSNPGNEGTLFEVAQESPVDLVPSALRTIFEVIAPINLVLPEIAGLSISQGLRTGCNGFFYVDHLGRFGDAERIRLSPLFNNEELTVPADCLQPVVRRQSELTGSANAAQVNGRALDLSRWVLPEDAGIVNHAKHLYEREKVPVPKVFPVELASFIRRAADTIYTAGNEPKRIPELSAVKTNARPPGGDQSPRFWYMLPPFARRHRPEAFVPRVNQGTPWVETNTDPPVLIDANFSTIWDETSDWTRFAIQAMLNSAWCRTCMEVLGTPLGGGALKLEAIQLRRLPIPRLNEAELASLDAKGRTISTASRSLPASVDRFVLAKITGLNESDSNISKMLGSLKATSISLSQERQRKGV